MSPIRSWHLSRAAAVVRASGIIAYPTEAVYGLGCLPMDRAAVLRILALKHRPAAKGLIVVAAEASQLRGYVHFPSAAIEKQVMASWPGPVTWLLPADPEVPQWLRGAHRTLAVRVSAHPVVHALCRKLGPLVSTSANPAGMEPARSAAEVRAYFGREVDYIVPGRVGPKTLPTEIRDARTGAVIRPGG
jgi:L-threonylcarbamoyladenylate synthase